MIKLQIIGNLGKDCIVKEVNGKNVINFSVAHTERYKDSQGNQKDRTTWVECAYWTDRTAVAQYLTRGRTVYAEGSPEADAYTNKEGQADNQSEKDQGINDVKTLQESFSRLDETKAAREPVLRWKE